MKNLYQRFSDLSNRSARTVGTCISAKFGSCVIQYPGGALVEARGAGTVGQSYFVRDGRLDGEAPNLPILEIEV